MPITVSFNGTNYTIPLRGETGYASTLDSYFVAIASGCLQKIGGAFTLTADANFGASFGLVSKYFKSISSNISTAGVLRVAVGDSIGWRNNANSGNLLLSVNGSDQLLFNGQPLIGDGTVTSVALSMPSIFSVAGSPITTAGTLAATLAIESANTVFAGPSGGSSAIPTFRSLVPNDVPDPRNYLLNSDFALWQRGTSVTVAHNATTYLADRWFVQNTIGVASVVTSSRTAATLDGSVYAASVQVTTSGSSLTPLLCGLFQTLENRDSRQLSNQNLVFSCSVKALGKVNSVAISIFENLASESKALTFIGGGTISVTSGSFTAGNATANVSNAYLPSGTLGIGVQINGVSSGRPYDVGNGFVVELAMLNIGTSSGSWKRCYPTFEGEFSACQRFCETSYPFTVIPGTPNNETQPVKADNTEPTLALLAIIPFKTTKFHNGSRVVSFWSKNGSSSQLSNYSGTDCGAASGSPFDEQVDHFVIFNTSSGNITTTNGEYFGNWLAEYEI